MLNLRRLYGHTYRVRDSRIPCHFGSIVPFGDDQLMAVADAKAAKKLAALPCVTAEYDDDTFSFDLDAFERVAEIMRPVRR